MKAVEFTGYGGPEVLAIDDEAFPGDAAPAKR